MTAIFFDATVDDAARRQHLYAGELFVYAPRPSTLALCDLARQVIEAAFAPREPRSAQFHLTITEFADIASQLRQTLSEHPAVRDALRELLAEFGCDLGRTYFHAPMLRCVPSDGFLRPWGQAFALHPHRDTWFSSPFAQVNWWLPLYEIGPASGLAIHPEYWRQAARNSSGGYDYDACFPEAAATRVAPQMRELATNPPRADEPVALDSALRPLCPAGGVLLFSGAHLHTSVPNTSGRTRFSLDFRTVHLDDVRDGRGAPNVDSACKGSVLRDFLRADDLAPLPPDVLARHAEGAAPAAHEGAIR